MKVLIVSRGMPLKEDPMFGVFEMDQARALAEYGHEVCFFSVDLRSLRHKRSFGMRAEDRDGIKVFHLSLPVGAIPRKLRHLIRKKAVSYLYHKAFAKATKPDIIHAHFFDIAYCTVPLSKKTHIPLVVTEHSSVLNQPAVSSALRKEAYVAYTNASQVISVSSALKRSIERHIGAESVVIHNTIDLALFCQIHPERHQGFVYISVSNLVSSKRIDLLVDAFAAVRKEYLDSQLVIVGDGPEKEKLESASERLRLTDAITFTGKITRPEIAELYKKADCFVLPSESETFGVAYAEAMAAGIPVIATKCGGPEDFVTADNGMMINTDDLEGLIHSMIAIRKNKNQYLSESIKSYVMQAFSHEVLANELTNTYNNILGNL